MKKYTLMMLAGSLLAFASCNTSGTEDAATQKAREDSIVNARTAEMEAKMKRNNDSLINAAAQAKADSMIGGLKSTAQQTGSVAAKPGEKTTKKIEKGNVPTKDVRTGGFGTQSDANRSKDKNAVEAGGFGTQSDKKQTNNKKTVEGGGFGTQADKKK